MKQSILNLALNNIFLIRQQNEKVANKNKELALKDEKFRAIYEEFVSEKIENARKEAFGEPVDKSKEKKLSVEIKKRLKELNIDSIEPKYSCRDCEDSGFVNGSYCKCLKAEITKILLKNSGFKKLEKFEDSNFDIFENPEEMKKVYSVMEKWCKTNSEKNLICLTGPTGTGKTHLTECMASELTLQNKIVLLTTSYNLLEDFVKVHKGQSTLENYLDCEVLFIDDLGTEPIFNNITREYLYLLINERKMKNLRTIITTNLSPSEIRDRYDERIFSRIMDKKSSIVLKISGSDKRLIKK